MGEHLKDAIIQRLQAKEEERIQQAISEIDREEIKRQEKLKIDHQLVAAAKELRATIFEHHQKRYPRGLARWFGKKAIKMAYDHEEDLTTILENCDKVRAEAIAMNASEEEANEMLDDARWNFHSRLTTPILVREPVQMVNEHQFQYGWQFAIRKHASPKQKAYFQTSSVLILRAVEELHTGEVAQEHYYTMEVTDRYGDEFELKSYTKGVEDDEIAMVGKNAHMHALGLMQQALEELQQ